MNDDEFKELVNDISKKCTDTQKKVLSRTLLYELLKSSDFSFEERKRILYAFEITR